MAPSQSDKTPFHPAFGVSSIKNHIAIVLELDKVQYDVWTELFLNTEKAYGVSDHLVDPAKDDPPPATVDKALWGRLDAVVKQWLYATISDDILQTVVETGFTAKQTWERIHALFNDNKHSRAVLLEQQFSATHMDNFPNVSSYCQALKRLADQLKNAGAAITDDRLVLHMVTNLSAGYDGIAILIQQSEPLPSFFKARSMLALEETRKAKSTSSSSTTAALAATTDGDVSAHAAPVRTNQPTFRQQSGRGRGNNHNYYSRGRSNRGRGGGSRNSSSSTQRPPQPSTQGPTSAGNWVWVPATATPSPWHVAQAWQPPPCLYSTQGWAPPSTPGAGVLGPRQQQAYMVQAPAYPLSSQPPPPPAYYPTELAAAVQSVSLQEPDDSWYMDTGASAHMTSDSGPTDGDPSYEMQ